MYGNWSICADDLFDIFNLNVYKYAPKCLSSNISKAIGCNRVLIEPLLITQLIKSQFSDLSSAKNFWEVIFVDSACPN